MAFVEGTSGTSTHAPGARLSTKAGTANSTRTYPPPPPTIVRPDSPSSAQTVDLSIMGELGPNDVRITMQPHSGIPLQHLVQQIYQRRGYSISSTDLQPLLEHEFQRKESKDKIRRAVSAVNRNLPESFPTRTQYRAREAGEPPKESCFLGDQKGWRTTQSKWYFAFMERPFGAIGKKRAPTLWKQAITLYKNTVDRVLERNIERIINEEVSNGRLVTEDGLVRVVLERDTSPPASSPPSAPGPTRVPSEAGDITLPDAGMIREDARAVLERRIALAELDDDTQQNLINLLESIVEKKKRRACKLSWRHIIFKLAKLVFYPGCLLFLFVSVGAIIKAKDPQTYERYIGSWLDIFHGVRCDATRSSTSCDQPLVVPSPSLPPSP